MMFKGEGERKGGILFQHFDCGVWNEDGEGREGGYTLTLSLNLGEKFGMLASSRCISHTRSLLPFSRISFFSFQFKVER